MAIVMGKVDLSSKISQFMKELGVIIFKKDRARRLTQMGEHSLVNSTLTKWMEKEFLIGQMVILTVVPSKQIKNTALEL